MKHEGEKEKKNNLSEKMMVTEEKKIIATSHAQQQNVYVYVSSIRAFVFTLYRMEFLSSLKHILLSF